MYDYNFVFAFDWVIESLRNWYLFLTPEQRGLAYACPKKEEAFIIAEVARRRGLSPWDKIVTMLVVAHSYVIAYPTCFGQAITFLIRGTLLANADVI